MRASSYVVYSEEGGDVAQTKKKGDAAAVIMPALADSELHRTFLQDPVLLHLDFTWTLGTCVFSGLLYGG